LSRRIENTSKSPLQLSALLVFLLVSPSQTRHDEFRYSERGLGGYSRYSKVAPHDLVALPTLVS
jgi:hypothetical protein